MHLHSGVGVVFLLSVLNGQQLEELLRVLSFTPFSFCCGTTVWLYHGRGGHHASSTFRMRGSGRAPPGAGRDPLEEMFGVRMVDHVSLFVVFIETFGSFDSQLDWFYCVARY
ncbi:hypothetical protein PAPYR_11252 [Paratrimastix pyriformis]|uniref:Secreted protein n=1 Tax=Paratrimastix pyriformis TaxID=342808 RepID=A0ABQ8UBD7_9EUKA|nr:hypothetical protein PAPYR_11252 [Paratrimastix pyriformis]